MSTRIKHFRKLRGLTLLKLAEALGTTPQTVQRLESGTMSVSVAWLERFAKVLDVTAPELLATKSSGTFRFLGSVLDTGVVRHSKRREVSDLTAWDLLQGDVCVHLLEAVGPYPTNAYVLGCTRADNSLQRVAGRDCIVKVSAAFSKQEGESDILLCRVLSGSSPDVWTLVPLNTAQDTAYDVDLEWIAFVTGVFASVS